MEWFKYNINELTDDQYDRYFGLMTEERKKYITSIKDLEKRKQSVAGEMLLKRGISSLFEIDETEIAVSLKSNGKPFIENLGIYFSISHSGDYAVCAIDEKPIGIDIEKIRPVNLKTTSRFCNTEEMDYINATDSINRFFEIWTAKESAYKLLDDEIKNFKFIDTFKFNKKYFYIENYIICIVEEN